MNAARGVMWLVLAQLASGAALAQGARGAQRAQGAQGAPGAQRSAESGAIAPCVSCHGDRGEGNVATGVPRLAGLPAGYLARQLAAYAQGTRVNAIMSPIARELTPAQRSAAATSFAGRAGPWSAPLEHAGASAARRAALLLFRGDEAAGVQACVNCHGPGASGEPPHLPYLTGQPRSYLATALGEWRSGGRRTDPSGQMNAIATRLSEADVAALSAWLSDQPPPDPAQWLATRPATPLASRR